MNGLPAAERAIQGYLRTLTERRGRLEGLDRVDEELADMDDGVHATADWTLLNTIRSYIDACRRAEKVE